MLNTNWSERFLNIAISSVSNLIWIDDRRGHNDTYFEHIAVNLSIIDGLEEGSDY